jgi:hypothetical protein
MSDQPPLFNEALEDILARAPDNAARSIMLRAFLGTLCGYLRESEGSLPAASLLEWQAAHLRRTDGRTHL